MKLKNKIILFVIALGIFFYGGFHLSLAQQKPIAMKKAILLNIDGAIGPATQDYIHRGIKQAAQQGAGLIILQMDTPGGLDKSMRLIIKDILFSAIPIVTYVAPSGARAASAGTYILYASHVAAMAPGTNLGAATPVQIGGGGMFPDGKEKDKSDNGKSNQEKSTNPDAMTAKMTHDAVAYIRGLAKLHGRNVEWAEKAVTQAASLPADEALKLNVIDVIAQNVPDLLKQINERRVIVQGIPVILLTADMTVEEIQPDWRSRFLAVITDPSVAYILLLIGIYGLFFEFANPGFVLPGIVGGVSLLLALYAFQLLPVNYAGVALIFLGIAFLAAEAFMPSFGALGIGGIVSFVAGSILLLNTEAQGFTINWFLIALMALLSAVFFTVVGGLVLKSRKRAIVSGREQMFGAKGIATEDFTQEGWIRVHGEMWKAHSSEPIKRGETVVVKEINGLILIIEKI